MESVYFTHPKSNFLAKQTTIVLYLYFLHALFFCEFVCTCRFLTQANQSSSDSPILIDSIVNNFASLILIKCPCLVFIVHKLSFAVKNMGTTILVHPLQ